MACNLLIGRLIFSAYLVAFYEQENTTIYV